MIREIVKYGTDVLREKSTPVGKVTPEVRKLAADMIETMHANNGVGLAAEQIGRRERVCVIDITHAGDDRTAPDADANAGIPMPLVLIDPEIVATEGHQVCQEGCLSFPEIYAKIKRAKTITVAYTGLDGERRTARGTGLLARAVQHEIDHLDGVLIVDRMSPVQRVALAGKLKRLKAETVAGA